MVGQRHNATDVRASLPSLQLVERTADRALERSGTGYRMECRPMPACTNLSAFLYGKMRSSGDGLPGSN
jgi:hypothetical protein